MNEEPITPPCAECGKPTQGDFYDNPRRHYCNACGWRMESARWRKRRRIIRLPLFLRWLTRGVTR